MKAPDYTRPDIFIDPDGTITIVVPKNLDERGIEALLSALRPAQVYLNKYGNHCLVLHASQPKHHLTA